MTTVHCVSILCARYLSSLQNAQTWAVGKGLLHITMTGGVSFAHNDFDLLLPPYPSSLSPLPYSGSIPKFAAQPSHPCVYLFGTSFILGKAFFCLFRFFGSKRLDVSLWSWKDEIEPCLSVGTKWLNSSGFVSYDVGALWLPHGPMWVCVYSDEAFWLDFEH